MDGGLLLLVIVFVVWAMLAAAYAFVPMFGMPAAGRMWRAGAIVFPPLSLSLVLSGIARRRKRGGKR